jgi:hypothetical protein
LGDWVVVGWVGASRSQCGKVAWSRENMYICVCIAALPTPNHTITLAQPYTPVPIRSMPAAPRHHSHQIPPALIPAPACHVSLSRSTKYLIATPHTILIAHHRLLPTMPTRTSSSRSTIRTPHTNVNIEYKNIPSFRAACLSRSRHRFTVFAVGVTTTPSLFT